MNKKQCIILFTFVSILCLFAVFFNTYRVMAVDENVSLKAGGNNQFNGVLESGSFNLTNGNFYVNSIRQVSVNYIPIDENTTYFCNKNVYAVAYYKSDFKYLGYDLPKEMSFTSFKEASYMKIVFHNTDLTDSNVMLSLTSDVSFEPWFAFEEPTEPITEDGTEQPTEEPTESKTEPTTEGSKEPVEESTVDYLYTVILWFGLLIIVLLCLIVFRVG